MNHHQYPGVGNHGGAGRHPNHAHGQVPYQLSRPYTGPDGMYGQNPPNVHISQTPASPSMLPAIVPPQLPETPAKKGFSLSNLTSMANLNEIKGFVDRMGGIDGILSTVTKVQKVVGSISQMAPMVKVLFGSFGKKSIAQDDENNVERKPASRRKRRRTGTGSGRPKNAGGRRRGSKRKR
ncbi:tyrosine protein kinase [Paenibacillus soyae]|uniref:Tyrosine protein kinase n=1 Tax=Paenibacillus soyae TaxID=2969249 RepID=A0A9X2S8U6_9BACL|nr:tyrosine protein kinase [Paenibacillus soyae]MCR2804530.1 tyrosine protein kinase [Paenibacillus soyae]